MPITGPIPTLEQTKVRVIFKGFFLAKVKERREGSSVVDRALIGAIDPTLPPPDLTAPEDPPLACHQPVVHVLGITSNGIVKSLTYVPTERAKDFSLTVFNAQSAEITPEILRFQKDTDLFNRLDDRENDKKDFRWFVDFDDLHRLSGGERVNVNEDKLVPKFYLNKGIFHASDLSDGQVRFKKPKSVSKPNKLFGRFAMEITARVTLTTGQTAVFRKGSDPAVFTIAAGHAADDEIDRYEIVFDCQCRSREESEVSDLNLIYRYRLVTNVEPTDEVSLEPDRSPSDIVADSIPILNPEVYCVGGGYGGG